MASKPAHLAERVAERLRGVGGLVAPETAPERDPGRADQREPAQPSPAPPRRTAPQAATEAAHDGIGTLPATSSVEGDEARSGVNAQGLGEAKEKSREEPDEGRNAPAAVARDDSALSLPAAPLLPPVDMAALEKAGLVVGHKVRTRISEEFRITVGQILRSMHANYSPGRGAPNVIMVTSARPGEGKTFATLNIAGSIAQHSQREVIIIDVDAKQRSITTDLDLAERQGLLDLSTNSALRIEDVLIRTSMPHLSLIPVGSGTVETETAPARPVSSLVERIARRYPNAVVLLDAPPCLSTSDPSTLAPSVGQIVMVVEAERTQRNEIAAALDLVKACPSVMLMLNKIRLTTSHTLGAYHYFGTYS